MTPPIATSTAMMVAAAVGPGAAQDLHPILTEQTSGTSVLLQAVSAVSDRVVWASGHGGTFVRTTDGGATWQAGVVPGADTLQFRDVHAVSADTAYLLSAGPGALSRIYRTTDAGRHWKPRFTNADPNAFFDCMDFWDSDHGLAFSDAVNGRLVIIRTEDGGTTWLPAARDNLPPALPGEGGFAASGTCLVAAGEREAWIGTGAGGAARVFRTDDRGKSWTVVTTPIVSGTGTSGIMTLDFRDPLHGIAAGGELRDTTEQRDHVAVTADGGRSWSLTGRTRLSGAIYGIAYVPGAATPTVVAVGPQGMDFSADEGRTWEHVSDRSYWSVGFASAAVGWAVGPEGRITRIAFR